MGVVSSRELALSATYIGFDVARGDWPVVDKERRFPDMCVELLSLDFAGKERARLRLCESLPVSVETRSGIWKDKDRLGCFGS